jgi:hypothetical protein
MDPAGIVAMAAAVIAALGFLYRAVLGEWNLRSALEKRKQRQRKVGAGSDTGAISLENIHDSPVSIAAGDSGSVASGVIHAGGHVAGRDVNITYQGVSQPTGVTALH